MSAKLSESGCGLVAAWGGYATLRILVRQGKLGHLIDEEIDNVTIGTGEVIGYEFDAATVVAAKMISLDCHNANR